MRLSSRVPLSFCVLAVLVSLGPAQPERVLAARQDRPSPAATAVDIYATDKDGRPVDNLRPSDVTVTVDGKPRRVQWVRRVSRGPGSLTDASSRQARGDADLSFAAEPVRSLVVVIDQTSLMRGDERPAIQAGGALVDRMGIADRVALLRLPFSADQQLVLTTERPPLRDSLQRTAGLIARPRPTVTADAPLGTDGLFVSAASSAENPDTPPPVPTSGVSASAPESELARTRGSLAGLTALVKVLRTVPGRKAVAVVSAGLFSSDARLIADAGAAAAASRVTIYAVELPASRDGAGKAFDAEPLRQLARSTGGFSIAAGSSVERSVERVTADLGACFAMGLESAEGDQGGYTPEVRVTAQRRDLTVRSASWLSSGPPPDDMVPAPSPVAPAPVAVSGPRPTSPPAAAAPRDPLLEVVLARVYDYVDAYEASYSALVAEEAYVQTSGQRSARLKSDLLLVRSDGSETWACFRDVFEADGRPVRDREDRLKKLFLEPGVQAEAQLMMIKDESARYNIGPVLRNANVPLFALMFLNRRNRDGFRFKVSGRTDVAGVPALRLDYREVGRPTVISRDGLADLPSAGWFSVEEATGAVIESGIKVDAPDFQAEIRVRYRMNPGLGMWVPGEMKETYKTLRRTTVGSMLLFDISMEGKATYSKFRRFQVQTEEKIIGPKKD
jgi:VWFA-related protein